MKSARESGAALIESLLLGLVLIVPVMLALAVLSDIQAGALATTAAVREAGTEAARSGSLMKADASVDRAVTLALVDQGLDPEAARIEWTADLSRGGAVEVIVRYPIEVFQLPFLGDVGGPRIWVRARHITRVDPYASRGT